MELSATGSLLSSQLIKALGNTLMHSLWQGVLLAFVGGLVVIFTKKQSAAVRYNLLIAAMLLFACGTVVTFLGQLQSPEAKHAVIVNTGNAVPANAAVIQSQSPASPAYEAKQSVGSILVDYLNEHSNTIVLIWFLIICAKSIKLAAGVYEVYQLKTTKIKALDKYWNDRLAQLSAHLKIKQVIGIVESGIAKVPMVIGHFKPLILIPVGFINALSTDEVEAILVHELAHIRRRDYLVNLLQSFMEIVFFFNPAVLWISQLIKAERENCCDDIALEQTSSKYGYIQALLSCQEYQAPGLSMALANNKSNLLNRVKRMVNNHNQSLNIMEKTLLTICLVAAGFCTVAFSANKENKNTPVKVSIAKHQQTKEHTVTVDPKVGYVFKTDNKTTYKFNKTGSKISDLKVNGKTVPGSQLGKYTPQIDALLKQNEQTKQTESNQTPVAAADTSNGKVKIYKPAEVGDGTVMMLHQSKNGKAKATYLFKKDGTLYQVFMNRKMVESFYVNGEQKPVSQNREKIDELLDEYADITQPVPPVAPMMAMTPMPAMAPVAAISMNPMPPMAPMKPMAMASMQSMTPMPAMPPMAAMAPMPPIPPLKPDGRMKEAADILIKKGIIKDRNDFEMSLSNKRLTVDGLLQPEELHQQLLKIFVKKSGDKVNWNYSRHESSESSDETTDK
ncbi:M56 family metallopeptidase [Mucilaginibacter sp.]|uniref:M56 family metallopeptidase n=1 Tax=Mucilaginibacter sp. TaxID=1882438 RepID=UPI0025D8CBD7|nr:M56 family metallopeptidase [Mucilaginibacter sp.]